MTEVVIRSKIVTVIAKRLIEKELKKKLGPGSQIDISSFQMNMDDGYANVHMEADVKVSSKDILELIK